MDDGANWSIDWVDGRGESLRAHTTHAGKCVDSMSQLIKAAKVREIQDGWGCAGLD